MYKGQEIPIKEFIPSITSRHRTCGSVSARSDGLTHPEARELQEALLNMHCWSHNAEANPECKTSFCAQSEQLH